MDLHSTLTFQIHTHKGLLTLQEDVTLNKGQDFTLDVRDNTNFYMKDTQRWVNIGGLIR